MIKMLKLKKIINEQVSSSEFTNLNNVIGYHYGSKLNPSILFNSGDESHVRQGTGYYLYLLKGNEKPHIIEPRHKGEGVGLHFYKLNNGKFINNNRAGFNFLLNFIKSSNLYSLKPTIRYLRSTSVFYNASICIEESGFGLKFENFSSKLSERLKEEGISGVFFNQWIDGIKVDCVVLFDPRIASEIRR